MWSYLYEASFKYTGTVSIEYSHIPAALDSTTDQLTVHVSELRYQRKVYLSIGEYVSRSCCTF